MWEDDLRSTCAGDVETADRVIECVPQLLQSDAYLLRVDVNERAIAHRLAIYVQNAFPDWHVDCEYNRDGHDPKEIDFGSGDDGEQGSRVYPDVIVHRRGTAENFVVFELKKSSNPEPDERDFLKLHGYCRQLGYRHGVFIRFAVLTDESAVERAEFVHA